MITLRGGIDKMVNKHHLYPALIKKYGQEEIGLAEKTWPLPIKTGMCLVAIVSSGTGWSSGDIVVAFDVTERPRYEQLIELCRNGKWSAIKLFYLPEEMLDRCRVRHDP